MCTKIVTTTSVMSRKLGINKSHFTITAGAALYTLGLKEKANDIDIVVDPKHFYEFVDNLQERGVIITPKPFLYDVTVFDKDLQVTDVVKQQCYTFEFNGIEIDFGVDRLHHLDLKNINPRDESIVGVHTLRSVIIFYRSIDIDILDKLE